jgi:hypothetical protein
MGRVLAFRRNATGRVMRRPFGMSGETEPSLDPRGPGAHSTLPWRQATELLRCIEIFGPDSGARCRHELLGDPLPEFETDPAISSPVPFEAGRDAAGGRTAHLGGISVTLLPDAHSSDPAMANRAATSVLLVENPSINWTANGRGIVTAITGPESPRATIQTTYGPGVSRASASGYGRGTAAGDPDTTLGYHEGQHGVDFLRFMRANSFPVFAGAVGMTVARVRLAAQAYQRERAAYVERMQLLSVERTDCVGSTASAPDRVRVICDESRRRAGRP